jgi:hypothetical protein
LFVPPTVAVNVWLCDGSKDTEDGVSETVTGEVSITVAIADFVESATLVAVTVTISVPVIEAGAVYRPSAAMRPIMGLRDQVKSVFGPSQAEAFEILILNC